MVAESIVIFLPIDQLGCWRACAGVTVSQFVSRSIEERSSGGRQDDPADIFPPVSLETLENGAVFAIDGNDIHPLFCRFSQDDAARHDQRLFVGQRDVSSRLDRVEGRKEAGRSDHGGNDHIRAG